MQVSRILLGLLATATVSAFAPLPAFTLSQGQVSSKTVLFISSWGTKGKSVSKEDMESKNIEKNIQAYLKAPESVEARSNIDGTVMVSGLVRYKERTDQFIFDLLNNEESAFEFSKIVAFVDDVAFAKKRLLSRSARYTGLLNKLDFVQASSAGSLPTVDQLDGVKSWVACFDQGDMLAMLQEVASLAKSASSVENVAILLANAGELDVGKATAAVQALKDSGKKYTLVAVGKLEDHAEGKIPYSFKEFDSAEGVLSSEAIFSRDEAMRIITECLQLECGVDKALTFSEVYDVNATEAKLIKGLREAGYARPQEVDHMLRDGPAKYQAAIDEFRLKNPNYKDGYYTTEAWWEDEKFQASVRKSSLRAQEEIQKVKDARAEKIEEIAKEWAKREYFRQSMAGTVEEGMTEAQFTESVWERAIFEGDLKYRQMNGEVADPEAELADFKSRQERKKEAMLKRAKEELKEILAEEDLGGEDLDAKLDSLEASADNTEK